MIELILYPSGTKYKYKTKKEALRDVKGNGLKAYTYELQDLEKDTIYMAGLWITKREYGLLENGYTLKGIRIARRLDK